MKAIFKILMVVIALSLVVGVSLFVMNQNDDDGGDDGGDDDNYISFYLYDNYENDSTAGVLSQNTHLAEGIWVKGYGDTKLDCFLDACERVGIPVEASGGYISSWNGISDGNFCQMGWMRNDWTTSIHLSSEESFDVRYMAIGHGRWTNGTGGAPPTPQQTPDDIKWYWGESMPVGSGTAVKFHFYDNYVYDPASSSASVSPSLTKKFVANGYNVTGYGDTMAKAFNDACLKCYGEDVVLAYNHDSDIINRIGMVSGNFHVLLWNGAEWEVTGLADIEFKEGLIVAIGHGPLSDTDDVPKPVKKGSELGWAL